LPEPIRGVSDGIPPRKDPHVFRESAMVLVAILPGLAWLNLHRVKAPLSAWIINVGGLAAIIAICWAMALWTIDLRGENVAALNIGNWVVDGNALQWSIVAFGSYVMLSWAQSLQLRDRPSFALLLKTPSMRGIMALATMQQAINYGVMGWTAYYLVTNFDQSLAQVGMMLGLLTATVGIAAPMIGGTLSDVFRRMHPSGRMHLLLVSMSLSPVMAILAFTADSIAMFYVVFVFLSLFTTMWLPMVYATIMDLVLPRMRGIAMSFYILITTILGLGLGPYAVGLMSDITGDLSASIINLYWTAPIMIGLAIFLIWKLPGDERSAIDRARAAGEPI
jgi:MFS transporter, Spinster family, sphingosine-1-phosphate transporter